MIGEGAKMKSFYRSLFRGMFLALLILGVLMTMPPVHAQEKPDLDEVPKRVMESLKSKFPKALIHKWSKEKEGDIIVYDFEFKQEGRKFEADIKEDGTIHNWEKEIKQRDLPKAVKMAVKKNYARSTLKEIMEITAVKDGMDALEGYEIVLKTKDKKEIEVMIAPDGKILEESVE